MYFHKLKDCSLKWYPPKVSGPHSAGLVREGATWKETVRRLEKTNQEICRARTFPTSFKRGQAGLEGERSAHQTISITPQVMLMTGQLSHKEGSLTVNGDIEGVMCPMVVDTGSSVTVIRPDLLSKQTLSRLRATNNVLKTATGETAEVCAKLRLWVRIGGTQVSHEVLVANISDRFILGLDFLMAHGCTVDSAGGSLRIGAEEVLLHKPLPSEQARCYWVTAVEDTLILPHSKASVAAKIMGNALCEPWGKIGPSMTAMLPTDVMVGKTLIDAQRILSRWGWLPSLVHRGKFVAARRWQVVSL